MPTRRLGSGASESPTRSGRKRNGRSHAPSGPVVDGRTGAIIDESEPDEQFDEDAFRGRLLEVNDKEILRTIAGLRAELTGAKSEHGKTGRMVQAVQQKLEIALLEVEAREERRNSQRLPI